jgi:hypothetical protein
MSVSDEAKMKALVAEAPSGKQAATTKRMIVLKHERSKTL